MSSLGTRQKTKHRGCSLCDYIKAKNSLVR